MEFSKKPFILIGVIVILIILGLFLFQRVNLFSPNTISPNILQLTSPIYSISGKIEKISGNTITLEYSANPPGILPPLPLPALPGTSPTPSPKSLIFQVYVTDKTAISPGLNPLAPTLLSATPSTQPPKLTIKDLKVGDIISVTLEKDLRTLMGNKFEAVSITLYPEITIPKENPSSTSSGLPLPRPASPAALPNP